MEIAAISEHLAQCRARDASIVVLSDFDGVWHHFTQLKAMVKTLWKERVLPKLFGELLQREFGAEDWTHAFQSCFDKPGAWPQIFARVAVKFEEHYGASVEPHYIRLTVEDECARLIADGDWQPHPGIREVLITLRDAGVPVAVVTSALRVYTQALLEKIELASFASVVFCADDAKRMIEEHHAKTKTLVDFYKPHPAAWLEALRGLRELAPAKGKGLVILFEDNPENGASAVKGILESGECCVGVLFARAGLSPAQTRELLIEDYGFSPAFIDEHICIIEPDLQLADLHQCLASGLGLAA